MYYSVAEIKEMMGADWLQQRRPAAPVETLLLDSRQVLMPAVSLFFAIKGQRHDGHRYLQQVYDAGVRHFVVQAPVNTDAMPEANFLRVPQVLDALQGLCAAHRRRFGIPVIGITGSNGKTIVKEWLYQLLAPEFHILHSPKSYNSQTGVPLSVWPLRDTHTLAIFEAGISQTGEMARLADIIRPDIGIFTNIGAAHSEGFHSDTEKIAEKMLLFSSARTLVYNADDPRIDHAARQWAAAAEGRRLLSWSREGNAAATLQLRQVEVSEQGHTRFVLDYPLGAAPAAATFDIPFSDPASLQNAVHCLVTAALLGLAPAAARDRVARLEPVEMRLELKGGIQRCMLINDAYNNDLNSLQIALEYARRQARQGRLTLILSDILQSGIPEKILYQDVARRIAQYGLFRFVGIGPAVQHLRELLPEHVRQHYFEDTTAFLAQVAALNFQDELILLKGARPFAFERIAARLEQKAHKTVLEVNLSALIHNLNTYNKLLKPGVKMMAMVKASGYGSGSAEVARLLEFHRADYLGVAYTDEGIELRQAGVQLPILVLNPEPGGFDALYRYKLEPVVYSLRQLDELIRFSGREKEMYIHLKLDTGMHRLGFEAQDLAPLLQRLQAHPNLHVRSVFSHLSASDNPAHDAFTHQQAAVFTQHAGVLSAGLGYAPLRHLANSGGIVRFPEYHFEMVRLGIGLYGIDACGLQPQLQVVNTLKATISQIKEVPAGDTVGYNRNGPVTRPSRIATISIGYADGFLRLAGNGRFSVLVHGMPAPTIGNVCMDMTMVDVSEIPQAQEGDEVLIFGEKHPVEHLARTLQTIPYEIFTNISERVKRVYWQE
jgi:Alr-MurF fusion protein